MRLPSSVSLVIWSLMMWMVGACGVSAQAATAVSPGVSAPPKAQERLNMVLAIVSSLPRAMAGTDVWQRRQPEQQPTAGPASKAQEPKVGRPSTVPKSGIPGHADLSLSRRAQVTTTTPTAHRETTATSEPESRTRSPRRTSTASATVEELPKASTRPGKVPGGIEQATERVVVVAQPVVTKGHTDRIELFAKEKTAKAAPKERTGSLKMGVSVVVKLVFVLALAYVTILALKTLSARKDGVSRSGQDIKLTDTVKLSQTSSLHVINFNGKQMLVGCSAGQVNLLREFEEAEAPEGEPVDQGRFAEYMAKYSGSSLQKSPANRVAGLLRDCATHLRSQGQRRPGSDKRLGDGNEA